jgi:hypothetical protein
MRRMRERLFETHMPSDPTAGGERLRRAPPGSRFHRIDDNTPHLPQPIRRNVVVRVFGDVDLHQIVRAPQ